MTNLTLGYRFTGKDTMLVPVVDDLLEKFPVGQVTVGVEYRVVSDEIVAAAGLAPESGIGTVEDTGVSLHVFATDEDGDLERIRFDCFDHEPHYHYITWPELTHEVIFIDPVSNGDVLEWALGCIATRLPQMLGRSGVANASALIDPERLDKALPLITESAYRSRFHSDREAVHRAALAARTPGSRAA